MGSKLYPLAVLTCAAIAALSFPAQATPKADCERGLQEAEVKLNERVLDPKLRDNMHRVFVRAQAAQKDGKYTQCAKLTHNMMELLQAK